MWYLFTLRSCDLYEMVEVFIYNPDTSVCSEGGRELKSVSQCVCVCVCVLGVWWLSVCV